jgi:hypothetical protein
VLAHVERNVRIDDVIVSVSAVDTLLAKAILVPLHVQLVLGVRLALGGKCNASTVADTERDKRRKNKIWGEGGSEEES